MALCPDVGNCPIDLLTPPAPSDWNCGNAGVAALCVEQCVPKESAMVASKAVTYHVVSPDVPAESFDASQAYEALLLPEDRINATDCATSCDCTGKKKKPCTTDELVLFFCPDSCQREGKIYEQEELEFLDGSAPFDMLYRTFPNGTCAEDVVVPPYGYLVPPVDLLKKPIYPATVPDNPALSLDKVCNTMADLGSCPALTTCVLQYEEQAAQVAMVRGAVPKTAWVSKLEPEERTAL